MNIKYPVGIETFANIIEEGYAYVDKTEIIYKLTQSGKYFFLSRPRRFGKSLMLSTMEAYFNGRKELFEGLWLGQAQGVDWTPRPVLRFNFVDVECSVNGIKSVLESHLIRWENQYGISDKDLNYPQRFRNVIAAACEVTGQKVVVLIDEYDKVLVNTMHEPEVHEDVKTVLKPLFGVLKGADQYIHFAILTGVSRFSKLNIFSDINNLRDISLSDEFCTLCGITEKELTESFKEGIRNFAEVQGVSSNEMAKILKDNYDGYHFSQNSPDIYNPFSLINAFAENKILHRWFESGTPTFLVKMMQESDLDIHSLFTTEADSASLSSSEMSFTNLTALLYQTGYLTIKDYNKEDMEYTLGIPNREVAEGMFKCLLPEYSGQGKDPSMLAVRKIRNAIRAGQPEEMMGQLQTFFSRIPYTLSKGRAESYFQNNLYIIFSLLGFAVQAEYTTARGRIDILLQTPKYVYIMELKLNGTPEEALQQIEDNGYCEPFDNDPRQLFRVGMSFSKRKRNIERWVVV